MKNPCAALTGVKRFPGVFPLILMVSLLLSACGSGGSGNTSSLTAVQTTAVAGIAAAGAPLAGKVHLSDSSAFKIYSTNTTINRDGSFSIDTTGMTAPFILRATDTAGNPLYYSFAKAPGIVNINPLTNLAVAIAAGASSMQDLNYLHLNHDSARMLNIASALDQATSNISSSLQPLLSLYGTNITDPLTGSYQVNKQGLDGLFDDVSFSFSGGTVSITRKDNQASIFNGSDPLLSGITSWSINIIALPTPISYPTPGNAELTLKVQGNLPSGALIKNISFSVLLPLGTTVTLDSSDPKGLTAVTNTAIPTGVATGANIYPAPVLSPTNNTLTVSMSSVAGFGVGDFIKIRCIASTQKLRDATTPDSFSVTSFSMYADIYNNQKLKGLTIVPDTFTSLPTYPPIY